MRLSQAAGSHPDQTKMSQNEVDVFSAEVFRRENSSAAQPGNANTVRVLLNAG